MKPIGKFKLPYTLGKPPYLEPKLFDVSNTKEAESYVATLFGHFLKDKENKKLFNWGLNIDDSYKGADIIGDIDDKQVGIQLTQFVINNYLSRFNQGKRLCIRVAKKISHYYTPEVKINIQIFVGDKRKDKIPIASSNTFNKLSKIIAKKIEENINELKNNETFVFPVEDEELKSVAKAFSLLPMPSNANSAYFGFGNIFIDYAFDDIYITEEDINKEAERIYINKNNGKAEILLIWSENEQLMDYGNEICKELSEKFKDDCSFESVYFMSLDNIKYVFKRQLTVVKII